MTDLFARRFAGDLFAMSNLRPSDTGVEGAIIWVSTGEFGGTDAEHGPRVMVVPGIKLTPGSHRPVSVRLTEPPHVLGELPDEMKSQVIEFVNGNRETLLAYWNGELRNSRIRIEVSSL